MYVINIVFQSIFTLLTPPALFFFISYLLVKHLSFPEISYAIAIAVGFLFGLVSMVKFAIAASEGLERLEKQIKKDKKD
jgi:hypothetical protein